MGPVEPGRRNIPPQSQSLSRPNSSTGKPQPARSYLSPSKDQPDGQPVFKQKALEKRQISLENDDASPSSPSSQGYSSQSSLDSSSNVSLRASLSESWTDDDSGVDVFSEGGESVYSTPANSPSSISTVVDGSSPQSVRVIPVVVSDKLKELGNNMLPSSLTVTEDEWETGDVWGDYLSQQKDWDWLNIEVEQDGMLTSWVSGLPVGVDFSKDLVIHINPSRRYLNAEEPPPRFKKKPSYREIEPIELENNRDKYASVSEGSRPAGVLVFESEFDPQLHKMMKSGDVDLQAYSSPELPFITAVVSRKDSEGQARGNKLKEIVKRELRQNLDALSQGVPRDIAVMRTRARNVRKQLELESISPEIIQYIEQEARLELAKANIDKTREVFTNTQKRVREQAVTERVLERFNRPDSVQNFLAQVEGYFKAKSPHELSAEELRAKQSERALQKYEALLEKPIPESQEQAEHAVYEILQALEVLEAQLRSLLYKGDIKNPDAMGFIKANLVCLGKDKLLLFQALDAPARRNMAGQLTWQSAMEIRRVGYRLDDGIAFPEQFRDEYLDPTHPPRELGQGKENIVYKLTYNTPAGTKVRVFKPEPALDGSGFRRIVSERIYHDALHPNLTARNLATGNIAQMMGMNVIPDMSFCEHNHKIGLAMDMAPGYMASSVLVDPSKGNEETPYGRCMLVDKKTRVSPAIRQKVMAGLADLELLDAICAQPDRHHSNFFIDYKTGQVTGIDNDICLYAFPDIVGSSQDLRQREWSRGCRVGYPRLINRSTYQRLMSLDSDEVCKSLPPCFDKSVGDALKSRIEKLKAHAWFLEGAGRIVDNWADWRLPGIGLTAEEYLLVSSQAIAEEGRARLRGVKPHVDPALVRFRRNMPLSQKEKAMVHDYLDLEQLNENDTANARYAISRSYYSQVV